MKIQDVVQRAQAMNLRLVRFLYCDNGSSQKLTAKSHGSLMVLQAWLWLEKSAAECGEWLSGGTRSRPLLPRGA